MATRTRDGKGRYIRTVKVTRRDFAAAEMRATGASYERIAAEMGFASRGHVHDAVTRALRDTPYDGAEDDKLLDLMRIDRLIEQAWEVMTTPHITVSNGKVVRRFAGFELRPDGTEALDADGKRIPLFEDIRDDAPVLAAINTIRQLLKRRAEIIGYDAPVKTRIEVITADMVESKIAELESQLALNDPADTSAP